ncbi:MAG: nuclear transport factor 2 family protein [Oscillospiraceae bacterium]|nr:nuclear transport factor 2 family protein [Oscillospiraceae bacterium]
MKLKKPVYTEAETMERVWQTEEIKKLVNRRMYYIANDWRRRELDDFWVTEPAHRRTASLGANWGWYVGMESIEKHYVLDYEEKRQAHLAAIRAARPEIEDRAENLGIGCMHIHPPTTPYLRLAYDGHTARGLWYIIGQDTVSRPDGTAEARWVLEKLAIDLVREKAGWRIWHLMTAYDLSAEAGTDYGQQPVYPAPDSDPCQRDFGTPDIPFLTHDNLFNWWDNYPAMPEPYFTFTEDMSYGPEGHPRYEEGGRAL